ncbi:hypothetical protein M422DRAFT_31588 [Sphaerobolus stellatus SS14]|uniref:Unplaced genomic scaffold SPHSTscaffold_58, whole genome shotgun sequence n=1 Tax=Sphaerobolus stellatus (strain SS14) TaxID=990650 RepID=A0A0C9VTX3_SPHS4|nr:hypothetical protein M422DRAFT_31588 [Sphaerobolus stellatus SS14]
MEKARRKPCSVCSRTISIPSNFLLVCSCGNAVHHGCLNPPMQPAKLLGMIAAYNQGVHELSFEAWRCQPCLTGQRKAGIKPVLATMVGPSSKEDRNKNMHVSIAKHTSEKPKHDLSTNGRREHPSVQRQLTQNRKGSSTWPPIRGRSKKEIPNAVSLQDSAKKSSAKPPVLRHSNAPVPTLPILPVVDSKVKSKEVVIEKGQIQREPVSNGHEVQAGLVSERNTAKQSKLLTTKPGKMSALGPPGAHVHVIKPPSIKVGQARVRSAISDDEEPAKVSKIPRIASPKSNSIISASAPSNEARSRPEHPPSEVQATSLIPPSDSTRFIPSSKAVLPPMIDLRRPPLKRKREVSKHAPLANTTISSNNNNIVSRPSEGSDMMGSPTKRRRIEGTEGKPRDKVEREQATTVEENPTGIQRHEGGERTSVEKIPSPTAQNTATKAEPFKKERATEDVQNQDSIGNEARMSELDKSAALRERCISEARQTAVKSMEQIKGDISDTILNLETSLSHSDMRGIKQEPIETEASMIPEHSCDEAPSSPAALELNGDHASVDVPLDPSLRQSSLDEEVVNGPSMTMTDTDTPVDGEKYDHVMSSPTTPACDKEELQAKDTYLSGSNSLQTPPASPSATALPVDQAQEDSVATTDTVEARSAQGDDTVDIPSQEEPTVPDPVEHGIEAGQEQTSSENTLAPVDTTGEPSEGVNSESFQKEFSEQLEYPSLPEEEDRMAADSPSHQIYSTGSAPNTSDDGKGLDSPTRPRCSIDKELHHEMLPDLSSYVQASLPTPRSLTPHRRSTSRNSHGNGIEEGIPRTEYQNAQASTNTANGKRRRRKGPMVERLLPLGTWYNLGKVGEEDHKYRTSKKRFAEQDINDDRSLPIGRKSASWAFFDHRKFKA